MIIGNHPSVLWAHGPTDDNNMYGGHSARSQGRPVVGYENNVGGSSTVFAMYENDSWTEYEAGVSAFPGRLLIDTHNVWYFLGGREVHVSTDNGRTWETHDSGLPASGQNANFDVRYFKKTNKLRFVAATGGGSGSKTLKIVEFVHDASLPPDDGMDIPSPPTNLRVVESD